MEQVKEAFEELMPWEKEELLDKYRPYGNDDDGEAISIDEVFDNFDTEDLLDGMDPEDIIDYVIENLSLTEDDIERMKEANKEE